MQEPQPQLAELLRTCVHPPSLLLQIVHIELLDLKGDGNNATRSPGGESVVLPDVARRYGVKYVLSDGEIMMQALLHRKFAGLRDVADVVVGDLVDVRQFVVKKSPRVHGEGRVVYLAIHDCHFLQRVQSVKTTFAGAVQVSEAGQGRKRKRTNSHGETTTMIAENVSINNVADGCVGPSPLTRPLPHYTADLPDPLSTDSVQRKTAGIQQDTHTNDHIMEHPNSISPPSSAPQPFAQQEEKDISAPKSDKSAGQNTLKNTFGARRIIIDEDEDDFFQAFPTDQNTVKKRRRALQKLDGNTSFNSQVSSVPDDSGKFVNSTTPSKPPKLESILPKPISPTHKLPRPPSQSSIAKVQRPARDGTLALSQAPSFYQPNPPPMTTNKAIQPPVRQVQTQSVQPQPQQPAALVATLLPSPPFHTLASLRNPTGSQTIPSKSYTLTTLAIISWTGTATIHRPGSLFPPKRHLKIVDPSLVASRPPSRQINLRQQPTQQPNSSSNFKPQNSFQDAVTVAVYIDAANFKPPAGTLVLFRGLVMQRLVNGDVILNAYGRLKDQVFEEPGIEGEQKVAGDAGGNTQGGTDKEEARKVEGEESSNLNNHWFITDHAKIRKLGHGSRLDYYLDWWAERQRVQLGMV